MATPLDLASIPPELLQELLFGSDRLRILQQQKRPLRDHLADYHAAVAAKGNGEKHVRDAARRVRVMAKLSRARTWADVDQLAVRKSLLKLRAQRPRRRGLGLATANHYLNSLKSFANWMIDQGRAERSPCRGIKPFAAQTDRRHPRRALTQDEVLKLIAAANAAKPIAGIPEPERALMYVVAVTTGLRAGELQSLTPASVHLNKPAHLTVAAAYTKNKRPANVPLRDDVAGLLRSYLADAGEWGHDRRLFRRPANGTYALRKNLAAAGVPYVLEGEYADFHAQRHTFVSNLFASGATPKEAQTLARHADARLTLGRYAHVAASAQRAAVERLPAIAGMAVTSTTVLSSATDRRA